MESHKTPKSFNSNDEINDLKKELLSDKKIIEQQNQIIKELLNKLNNYNTIINNLNNDIDNYKDIISKKDIELNNLKSQLNNNNILNNIKFVDTIAINFISSDKNLNYTTKCLKTNIFAEVEENLYKEYPQYRETNNSLLQMESKF